MKITATYDRIRDSIYARYERYFPTPIEVRLIQIMGGTTFTFGSVRRGNLPMTITLSRGKLLRSKRFRRAVLDGKGALCNDVKYAIQILGSEYERNVVEQFERDEKLEAAGWRLAYVQVKEIWNNPQQVRQNLLQFLR